MKTEEREAEIQATEEEDGFEPRYFFPSFFSFLSSLCFLPLLCQDLIHLFLLIFSHSFLFWESLFYSFMTWLSLFLSLLSTVFSRTSVSLALKNFTSFYSKNSFLSLHEKEFQVPSSSPVSFSHQTILIWKHIQTTSGWILILFFWCLTLCLLCLSLFSLITKYDGNLNMFNRLYEKVVIVCSAFVDMIPLSFILGFYVSFTAQRWWHQYTAIPWPDK